MKKKSLTLLLPSLLSGCTAFNATPVPDTTPPALVFVDGQIRESAAIIAHTQKRLLPPPVTRPVTPPRPTTTATPTTAVSSQSTALPPRPLLQATQLPALVMTGKPGQSSVVYLREAHQRSVSDWIPPFTLLRTEHGNVIARDNRDNQEFVFAECYSTAIAALILAAVTLYTERKAYEKDPATHRPGPGTMAFPAPATGHGIQR